MQGHEDDDEEVTEPRPRSGHPWYLYPTAIDSPNSPFRAWEPNQAVDLHAPYFSGPIERSNGLLNIPRDGAYLALTDVERPPLISDKWEIEPAYLSHDFEVQCIDTTVRLVRSASRDHMFEISD